jgi:hypothetical protein
VRDEVSFLGRTKMRAVLYQHAVACSASE